MNKFFKTVFAASAISVLLAACSDGTKAEPAARVVEQKAAQTQQQVFNRTAPIPVLNMSLDFLI